MTEYAIKVTDFCRCGSEFSVVGPPDDVSLRHNSWLKAHAVCRQQTLSVDSGGN